MDRNFAGYPEIISTSYLTGMSNEITFNREHWTFAKVELKKFTMQNYTTVEAYDFKFYAYKDNWVGSEYIRVRKIFEKVRQGYLS